MAAVVVGIDLAAGRGITALAALRGGDDRPALIDQVTLAGAADQDGAIAAWITPHAPAIIAMDAPLTLPAAVMAALRGVWGASGTGLRWGADFSQPPGPTQSPYTRAAERDPVWSQLGVRPFPVSFLGGLTLRAIVLAARLHASLPTTRIIEVFPTATLRILAPDPPHAGAKTTPARRAQAWSLLCSHIDGLVTDDEPPPSADVIDALAAAWTGWAHHQGASLAIGDVDEGQIIVPA